MPRMLKTYSLISVVLVILLSSLLLIDWEIDLPAITSQFGNDTLAAIVSFGFLLTALAFFLTRLETYWIRVGKEVCALVVIGIGVYGLIDLEMIPLPTSINSILMGLALLFTPRFFIFSQTLFLTAFFLAFSIIIGFFYAYYYYHAITQPPYTTFIASFAVMLLSSAFLLNTPDKGVVGLLQSSSLGGRIFRRLLPIVIAIPIILSWLQVLGKKKYHLDLPLESELIAFFMLLSFVLVTWGLSYWVSRTDNYRIRRKKTLDTLYAVLSALKKQNLFSEELLQTTTESLEADVGELWIYNPESNSLEFQTVWPPSYSEYKKTTALFSLKPGVGVPGEVFERKKIISLTSVPDQPLYFRREIAKQYGLHHVIGFPLLSENKPVGVILLNKVDGKEFSSDIENLIPVVSLIMGHYLMQSETQQKQIELAALVESSDLAIYRIDLDGIIRSWNKGAKQICGYEAEEVIGKNYALLLPEEKKNEAPWILQKLKRGLSLIEYESLRINKQGAPFDVSVTISPIFDQEKQVCGGSILMRNITAIKENRRALHEFEKELQRVTEILTNKFDYPLGKEKVE